MNDIIKDFKDEAYTLRQWIIYGVCLPVGLVALCLLASLFD